jgi:hypothetical protein
LSWLAEGAWADILGFAMIAPDPPQTGATRIARDRLEVVGFAEAERGDQEYWRQRSPAERLAALELMREVCYGYDPVADRLQRVLVVAELGRR